MSYPQLGYPYASAPQFLMATNSLSSCCESSGRPVADSGGMPSSPPGPLYCPVYEGRLLASARTQLSPALGVYGGPYASGQGYGNYVSYGTDAFYSLSTFDTKDATSPAPPSITSAAAYYPYDPSLGQYQYDRYGAMEGVTRRKNATRETTSTLKAWLQEHKKNPYPTKGEKIMLAIITKMTLTQVSTWFANARRRLKKENKMTWPPRTKSSEEKGYDDDEEEKCEPIMSEKENVSGKEKDPPLSDLEDFGSVESESSECDPKFHLRTTRRPGAAVAPVCVPAGEELSKACPTVDSIISDKPKIWSLAQTATSLRPSQYSSCMHRAPTADRGQDSPVATLRNWVDGIFHEPLFQHRALNQAGALHPTVAHESKRELFSTFHHQDPSKDRAAYPKLESKFCS